MDMKPTNRNPETKFEISNLDRNISTYVKYVCCEFIQSQELEVLYINNS